MGSFLCVTFDDGTTWLQTDVTISCDAPERATWLVVASFGVLIYVVGVPVVYIVSLWRVREHINPRNNPAHVPDKRKYSTVLFLTEIYKREYYYWEVVELIRKLIQTSLIVFLLNGSVMQMIIMIVVAMVFVQTLNEVKPYISEQANRLASIAQWEILIVSFLGLLMKVDLTNLDSTFEYDKQSLLTGFLVLACFMAPAFAVVQKRKEFYRFFFVNHCIPERSLKEVLDEDDDGEDLRDFRSSSSGARAASTSAAAAAAPGENPVMIIEFGGGPRKYTSESTTSGSSPLKNHAADNVRVVSFRVDASENPL